MAKDTRMVGDVVENVKAKPAPRVVRFAAAAGKQLARWDTAEKHGLFTDALIEALYALQRGGQKADGRICEAMSVGAGPRRLSNCR